MQDNMRRCRVQQWLLLGLLVAMAAGARRAVGAEQGTAIGNDAVGLAPMTNATAAAASLPQPSPTSSPHQNPSGLSCEERYERAVYELRRMRVRACLDTLDALLRRCRDDDDYDDAVTAATTKAPTTSNPPVRAKASFLKAKVLLLDGDWDAAEAAAAAALQWSAHQQRLADAGATMGGEHLARALKAAESLLVLVTSQRQAHDDAVTHVAHGRYEPAFWAATRALRLSWRALPLYLLRARASIELNLYSQAKVDVSAALRLSPRAPAGAPPPAMGHASSFTFSFAPHRQSACNSQNQPAIPSTSRQLRSEWRACCPTA